MTYQNISKNGVDTATPLEFDTTRSARQELTITVKARVNGFDVDICFSGHVEQLDAMTRRLTQLGATPQVAPVAPAQSGGNTPARKAAERVSAAYDGSGQAMCPVHRKPLSDGRYGPFCSAKAQPGDVQNDKGYCALKFD